MTSARRRRASALAWLSLSSITLAWAVGPDVLLDYRGPELERLAVDITRAEREVARTQLGLSGALEVEPLVEYTFEDPGSPAELGLDVEVGLEVAYLYDQPTLLIRQRDLLSARERYQDAQRDGVWEALLAHTNAIRTEFLFAQMQPDLAEAQQAASELQTQGQLGEVRDAEVALSRLEVDAARIALERTQQDLRAARAAAASFGIQGDLTFRPLRFALPQVSVQHTFAYQRAVIAVQLDELLSLQSSVYDILEEVNLSAGYEGEEFALSGSINFSDGLPGASIEGYYRETDPDAWHLSLGATLQLDDQTVDNFAGASRAVEEARNVLNETVYDIERELRELPREVGFAWRELELRQEEIALGTQWIEELEAELAVLPGQLESLNKQLALAEEQLTYLEAQLEAAAEDSKREVLSEAISNVQRQITDVSVSIRDAEGNLEATERDLESARSERADDEVEMYDIWSTYVTLVHSYLTLTDSDWAVQP